MRANAGARRNSAFSLVWTEWSSPTQKHQLIPPPPPPAPGLKQVLEKVPGSLAVGGLGSRMPRPHCDHGWKEKKDMGVTRPQVPLRQPFPVSLPQLGSMAGPEEEAETRGRGERAAACWAGESQGQRCRGLGPQTEAKPWKRDHVTRALVFDKRSLNKLENKCLTLSQSKYCPCSRSKPGRIRAGGSQAAGVGSRTPR